MKHYLLLFFTLICTASRAQKIDSIYVNLYTDSLKKGTYNYINIDGLLPDGSYMPLDSTHLIFTASAGRFYGNNLLLDKDFKEEKVSIKVVLRQAPSVSKSFVMYVKKKPDDEKLKTTEEILNEMRNKQKKKKKEN